MSDVSGECNIFADRLKALLKLRGLNPRQLSIKVGYRPDTVYAWLIRNVTPRALSLMDVADALDTTPNYLLGYTDNPDKEDKT